MPSRSTRRLARRSGPQDRRHQSRRDDTAAPFVVKSKVFVGISGGELGVRGRITALDEGTGKVDYVAYSTGPDKDVLLGKDYKPFYDFMKGKDLGVRTWPPDAWKIGGGTMWGWFSYDPDLNLLFYWTGNPGPWNSNQRPGDNIWTTTLFARIRRRGEARWAYQFNPHDLWDHDEIQENVLVDLELGGRHAEVLIHPGRNGYMYVIDRQTGEVISADPYDTVNAYKGVDLKTGRIIPNEDLKPDLSRMVKNVCPAPPGVKDWQPTAWSPRTQLLYVPHQHLCMNFKTSEVGYIAGTPYVGATVDMFAGSGRLSRRVHGLGSRQAKEGVVKLMRICRFGLARWSPPATSRSTERWTVGSKLSTRRTASHCGGSTWVRASSASLSPMRAPMASNM